VNVAVVQHAMGFLAEAAAQFVEAEQMQAEWRPSFSLLYSHRGFRYCDLLLDQGHVAEVEKRAVQGLKLAKRQHWIIDIALDHLSLGRAGLLTVQRDATGDLSEAILHLKHAVDGFRRASQQNYLPLGLLARAAIHTHTRAFALARKDLTEALTIATRCGFRLHECDAHLGFARLSLEEGDPAAARTHLAKAAKLVADTGYHRRDGELRELQGRCS
jgi:hypothetical protein